MNCPRINPVVSKPVCTPVLPAAYGTAAGHARLAPPAFAPPARTVHRLASGGTIAARLAARTNVYNMMRALTPNQRAASQTFKPYEIIPAGAERRSSPPAARNKWLKIMGPVPSSTDVLIQADAWRKYAHNGTDR